MAGKLSLGKYLHLTPLIGVLVAIYQDYGVRGIAGLQADLNAISLAGLQAKAGALIGGVVLIAVGVAARMFIGKNGYNKWIGTAIETIFVYAGTRAILQAMQAGRGYGSAGSGAAAARTTSSNPYNPHGMTAGR